MSVMIVPNLWMKRSAEDAAHFYAEAFEAVVRRRTFYPNVDLPPFQQEFAGQTLTIELDILGCPFVLINAGDEFTPSVANSFFINFDPLYDRSARENLDRTWEKLTDGGKILMDLGEYPFSPHYGWVEDRFGYSWQLMLTNPGGEQRPPVIPCLLFGGNQQNQAASALEYYGKVFSPSHVGGLYTYPEENGSVTSGAVMFSDIELAGNWFVLMDAAAGEAEFSEAVSYEIRVGTQDDIDYFWERLSAVPEAAVCGWVKDQFNVSWQIVPDSIEDLMLSPGAWKKLQAMSKIVIADFSD